MERLTLQKRLSLLLVILAAPFAGVSAAGLIDSGSSASGRAAAAVNAIKPDLNVDADTSIDASANGNSSNGSVNVNGSVNGGTRDTQTTPNGNNSQNGAINGNADLNASDNAAMNRDSINGNGSASNEIKITRDDIESDEAVTANISAMDVSTDADLKSFAMTELRKDSNLSSMAFSDSNLKVGYRAPGRFLGFIPLNMNVNVSVDASGDVNVSYPWYSFLVMSDRADLTAAIQNEVQAYFNEQGRTNIGLRSIQSATSTATTTGSMSSSTAALNANANAFANANANSALFSPAVRAELASRIQAILRSHLVSGSGTASSTQTANF